MKIVTNMNENMAKKYFLKPESYFNFDLPKELIAQTPLLKRDSSRLLVLNKDNGDITHKHFTDIID